MANKLVAFCLMCIVVAAAMQLSEAVVPNEERFKSCIGNCNADCKAAGNGQSFCEMKCDNDCNAKKEADGKYQSCFNNCRNECKSAGNGDSHCETKCVDECNDKEAADVAKYRQ